MSEIQAQSKSIYRIYRSGVKSAFYLYADSSYEIATGDWIHSTGVWKQTNDSVYLTSKYGFSVDSVHFEYKFEKGKKGNIIPYTIISHQELMKIVLYDKNFNIISETQYPFKRFLQFYGNEKYIKIFIKDGISSSLYDIPTEKFNSIKIYVDYPDPLRYNYQLSTKYIINNGSLLLNQR